MTDSLTNAPTETTVSAPGVASRARAWQIVVFVSVLALLGLVAYRMRNSGPLAPGPVGKGQPAPDFTITSFAGETYHLAELKGQVVVINFWASWCIPCEQEAAALENMWRRYKDQGVIFLGVDYVDTETEAKRFMARFDITYPNGPDLGTRISQSYRIKGVPETYIVDKNGTLAFVKIGPFLSESEISGAIEPLLK